MLEVSTVTDVHTSPRPPCSHHWHLSICPTVAQRLVSQRRRNWSQTVCSQEVTACFLVMSVPNCLPARHCWPVTTNTGNTQDPFVTMHGSCHHLPHLRQYFKFLFWRRSRVFLPHTSFFFFGGVMWLTLASSSVTMYCSNCCPWLEWHVECMSEGPIQWASQLMLYSAVNKMSAQHDWHLHHTHCHLLQCCLLLVNDCPAIMHSTAP